MDSSNSSSLAYLQFIKTIRNYLPYLLVAAAVACFGITAFITLQGSNQQATNFAATAETTATMPQARITIDIAGAVNMPGVYLLPLNSRIEDAVLAAGGFAEDTVDKEFVAKQLNLAAPLADGQKIYILHQHEDPNTVAISALGTTAVTNAKININTATLEQLETLPSVNATSANKIITNRPYRTVADLQTRKVISASTFSKIQSLIIAP